MESKKSNKITMQFVFSSFKVRLCVHIIYEEERRARAPITSHETFFVRIS